MSSSRGEDRAATTQPGSLLGHLLAASESLGGCVVLIRDAAKRILPGGHSDYMHAEAVVGRLTELIPPTQERMLSGAELFILLASAYLHDLGKDPCAADSDHGPASARKIRKTQALQNLFPSAHAEKYVRKVCEAHTGPVDRIGALRDSDSLDVQPHVDLNVTEKGIRPRMVAALLRLADFLDCVGDRVKWENLGCPDLRQFIVKPRIDPDDFSIGYEFQDDTVPQVAAACERCLAEELSELRPFLAPYGLYFEARTAETAQPLRTEPLSADELRQFDAKINRYCLRGVLSPGSEVPRE